MLAFNKSLFPSRRVSVSHLTTLTALLGVAFVSGCGGGNNASTRSTRPTTSGSVTASRQTGHVKLSIKWPIREADSGRYVPPYAQSLRFLLQSQSDANRIYVVTVQRPADVSQPQDVTFPEPILTGRYRLIGEAHVLSDAGDPAVAQAAQEVQVNLDQTADVQLSLATTINRLEVLGQPLRAQVGIPLGLQARAVAADGTTLFVPVGANGLKFSLVSGSATVENSGLLTATQAGTVRVRVIEAGIGLSAEADVAVEGSGSNQTNGGLALNAFPKVGGDARNTGQGYGPAFPAQGEQAWKITASSITPIVGPDSTVYVASYENGHGVLLAVNPDGSPKWKVQTTREIRALALAANGTLYGGGDGGVTAYASANGTVAWNADLPFNASHGLNIGANGLVYVSGEGQEGGTGGTLAALDGLTGAVRWSHETGASILATAALSTDGTTVYAPSIYGKMYAFDAVTGDLKWQFTTENNALVTTAAVVGPDNTVYVAEAGQFDFSTNQAPSNVYAVDGATGNVKWKRQFGEQFQSEGEMALSADGTRLYVVSKARGEGLYALNAGDGSTVWNNSSLGAGAFNHSHLALGGGGVLYLSGNEDEYIGVAAVDPSTGRRLWTFLPDEGGPVGNLAVSPNGHVLFTNFLDTERGFEIRALR